MGSWLSAAQSRIGTGKAEEKRSGSVRGDEASGTRKKNAGCRIGLRAQAANLKQKRGLASPIVTAPSRFPFEIKPSRLVRPAGD